MKIIHFDTKRQNRFNSSGRPVNDKNKILLVTNSVQTPFKNILIFLWNFSIDGATEQTSKF